MSKSIYIVFILTGLALCVFEEFASAKDAKAQHPPIVGIWYTQDHDGGIELYPCDDKICGRFYWLKADTSGSLSRDDHNPDLAKRGQPLCGMQFMGGFTPDPDEKGHYTDGWIYSPRHGKIFDAEMTLKDHNTLDLHGYVVLPLFGESQTWTRTKSLVKCSVK